MANGIRGVWVDWICALVLATAALAYALSSGVFWRTRKLRDRALAT